MTLRRRRRGLERHRRTRAWEGKYYLYEVEVFAPRDRPGRDEPRHRPLLGQPRRATARAARSSTSTTRRSSRRAGTRCASRRSTAPEDIVALRAARARLQRERRRRCRRRCAGTFQAFTASRTRTACGICSRARAGRLHPRPPAARLRHRHRSTRTGPTWQGPRRRLAAYPPDSDRAAGRDRRASRPGRLQLGLRPVALHRAGGQLRDRPRRARAHPRVPRDGPGARRARACAWSWTSSTTTPTRPGRTRSRSSTASCPATTTGSTRTAASRPAPAAPNTATEHAMMEKLMVDSRPDWATRLQGRRLPLRPHGPPHEGEHGAAARRAARPHPRARRRRRPRRSTSTAKAGTSARSRTTPAASTPRRPTWPAPASAPSTTACATARAAAARSAASRSRASSPASGTTRTATNQGSPSEQLDAAAARRRLDPRRPRRQPRGLHLLDRDGRPVDGQRRSTTTASRPATPPTRRRRSTTSRPTTTRRSSTRSSSRPRRRADVPSACACRTSGIDLVRPRAGRAVLPRRRRDPALEVAGPQQLQLRRLVQPLDFTLPDQQLGRRAAAGGDNQTYWPIMRPAPRATRH